MCNETVAALQVCACKFLETRTTSRQSRTRQTQPRLCSSENRNSIAESVGRPEMGTYWTPSSDRYDRFGKRWPSRHSILTHFDSKPYHGTDVLSGTGIWILNRTA